MPFLTALLLILPAVVFGQQEHFAIKQQLYRLYTTSMFLLADRNRNGALDMHEVVNKFKQIDADNNGRVSRSEFNNYIDQQVSHKRVFHDLLFDLCDADNDDIIDRHDYEKIFALMDKNGNGVISYFELTSYCTSFLNKHLLERPQSRNNK